MKRILNKVLILVVSVLFFSACKKQLEVTPLSVLDESQALKTFSGVEGAITNVYSQLKAENRYGKETIVWPDVLADNGISTGHSGRLVGEAANARGSHFTNWSSIYNAINNANLVLDAIANPSGISPAPTTSDLSNWEGQLKFLRALNYFDLVREYSYIPGAVISGQDKGGVPLMLTGIRSSELASTAKPARAPLADVYNQIYADLNTAIAKLPATSTQYPFRATQVAAQALLAKVALYNKDFVTAKTMADAVITAKGSTLRTAANYVAGWRTAINPESLFEVAFATSGESLGVNVSLQSNYTSLAIPGNQASTAGWGDMGASLSLLNDLGITLANPLTYRIANCAVASRSADVRNQLWEPGSTGRGITFIECTKYLGKNGTLYLDNVPLLRIAEMYLIRAEAQSASSTASVYNLTNAINDINTIRTNRGLAAYAGATTQAAVMDEVLLQRRLELAGEGNRFFDLKRLGKDISKSPYYSDLLFNDYRILPPIPASDIQLNPNLLQNSNY